MKCTAEIDVHKNDIDTFNLYCKFAKLYFSERKKILDKQDKVCKKFIKTYAEAKGKVKH